MHPQRFRALVPSAVVVAAAALISAGCGSSSSDASSSGGAKSSSKATSSHTDTMSTGSAHADTMSTASSAISSPGVDLRVTLDRLLGEHASLATLALQKSVAGEADAADVVTALSANTDDLSKAIASVYGNDAGASFKAQWQAHIGFFVNYATAVAKKDAAGRAKAKADLTAYATSFGSFLHGATGIDQKAATAALKMHAAELIGAVDSFAAGNYAKAYAQERTAYAHMYGTGDALAAAISTQKPRDLGTGDVTTAAADTRVLLDQQLAEHAFLATVALTKTMAGGKDAPAAVQALDANTVDLGTTIGSVYGAAAKSSFLAQWRAHIGFFVSYATGVVHQDQAAQDKAKQNLDAYSNSFATFLADATGGDRVAYRSALQEHVSGLLGAVDAAGDKDATQAWKLEREAYAHMFGTGDAMIAAIVQQNPAKFGRSAAGSGAAAGAGTSTMGMHK